MCDRTSREITKVPMTPLYPYMFKAFYDWLIDSNANPRIMVDASQPNVQVPQEYVTRDKILISIHPKFITGMNIGHTTISFYTKFKGKREFVVIPYYAMTELICWSSGLSIPLNMWLTSIEMASHPGGLEELFDMDEGPMPSDGVAMESLDKPLSEAAQKVSFEVLDSPVPKIQETSAVRERRHAEEAKNRPSFSLL